MCVFGTDGVVARLSLIYSAVIPVGCAAFGIYLGVPQVRENAKSRRSPLVGRSNIHLFLIHRLNAHLRYRLFDVCIQKSIRVLILN